jgi:uncharacterized membrane protein YfcA
MSGLIVAFVLILLIGVLLGLIGSGGSILTLPTLVHIAGIQPRSAVPMSLAVVGVTSFLGAVLHARRDQFHRKAALLFATTGVIGAYLGSAGTQLVSSRTLMLAFAGLLLGVGFIMLIKGDDDLPPGVCRPIRCLSIGAAVGLLTGFLGVGGGFLIVPALVLFAGLRAKLAIGTSLGIIAVNSASALAGQVRYTDLNWTLTLALTGLAIAGMLLGIRVADRISEKTFRKAFASLLVLVAIMVAVVNF